MMINSLKGISSTFRFLIKCVVILVLSVCVLPIINKTVIAETKPIDVGTYYSTNGPYDAIDCGDREVYFIGDHNQSGTCKLTGNTTTMVSLYGNGSYATVNVGSYQSIAVKWRSTSNKPWGVQVVSGSGTEEDPYVLIALSSEPPTTVTFLSGENGDFGKDDSDNPITEVEHSVEKNTPWDETWPPSTINPKDGYEFNGWDKDFPNTITESITFTAQYKKISYKIEYDFASGQAPTVANPSSYTVDETITISNKPTYVGYTFMGWTGTDITSPVEEVIFGPNVTGDRSYVANWKANEDTKYTVEYYYQTDGEYPSEPTKTHTRYGTTDTQAQVTNEDLITDEGYEFDEEAANIQSGTIAGDGSLKLKLFFKKQVKYKIEFDLDGGTCEGVSGTYVVYAKANETIILPRPSKSGYTFDYWYGSKYDAGDPFVVEGDHSFKAIWIKKTTPSSKTYITPKTGVE